MSPINAAVLGLQQAETALEVTAERIARAPSVDDTVSLSDEAVSLLAARNAYELNIQTLKATDEMTRKVLDILA